MRLALILALFLLWPVCGIAQAQKTLLAIFPHPDDESAVAEVLAKYAGLGYKVQLITATDGKDGTRVTKIPAGDVLGGLRKDESRCAAKKLGIEEPIFLGIDRLDTKNGVGKYFDSHKKLLELLKEQILAIDPELIITFGPDGDTSHSEHIVTGAAVTELLLREGWVERYPLYYLAWTMEQGRLFDLGHVDSRYLNVKVEYTQDEENKGLAVMSCYVTQYTAEEIAEDRQKKTGDASNVTHFRRLAVATGMQDGF